MSVLLWMHRGKGGMLKSSRESPFTESVSPLMQSDENQFSLISIGFDIDSLEIDATLTMDNSIFFGQCEFSLILDTRIRRLSDRFSGID
jgi:hypothetical protein